MASDSNPLKGWQESFSWDPFPWLGVPFPKDWVTCLCSNIKEAGKPHTQFSASTLGGNFCQQEKMWRIYYRTSLQLCLLYSYQFLLFEPYPSVARINGFVYVWLYSMSRNIPFLLGNATIVLVSITVWRPGEQRPPLHNALQERGVNTAPNM